MKMFAPCNICHYANSTPTQTAKQQQTHQHQHQHRNHHQQQQQQHYFGPSAMLILKVFAFVAICANAVTNVGAQIGYKRHLSELRIQELHNLAIRLEHSINPDKYACDSYYDYVCSRNRPLFTVMGHLPDVSELMQLLIELQNDSEEFAAKQKLMDFVASCHAYKSVDDCYREAFEYFKPIYAHVITKNHIDSSAHEHRAFLDLVGEFLKKAENTENFQRHPIRLKLQMLLEKFRTPHIFFRASELNHEYRSLRIYRESYQHNLRNLEQFRKRNSTYEMGIPRTMVDWSLYVYQSRNKPMSYYFPTLNVHLWMSLYNTTERQRDGKHFQDVAECLKLPQYVNVLEEARVLAVVYLKSFQNAWQEYHNWIRSLPANKEIFDHENEILKKHHLDNKRLFFTLYAQNFCDFGKELAENVFYIGLKQNQDFFSIYSCGYQTERFMDCL